MNKFNVLTNAVVRKLIAGDSSLMMGASAIASLVVSGHRMMMLLQAFNVALVMVSLRALSRSLECVEIMLINRWPRSSKK